MTTVLRRCRAIFGSADLLEVPPAVRRVEDAVYVPFPSGGAWGLFDRGACIDGVVREPVAAPPEALAAHDHPAAAGDRVHLYVGAMTAHYGHFITDVLSRLWPMLTWDGPKPYLLFHGPADHELWRRSGAITAVLGRFGLGIDDLVGFDTLHRIPRLVVADPCFAGGRSAHRAYRDLCEHVGRPFWDDAHVDTIERPVFLSKMRLPKGSMHKIDNEDALAEALARRGVDIVFPETLSFADQVGLFARRRTVMGIVGSALHTSLFSAPHRRIIGLHWCPTINANFRMIDALNRNRSYYYCQHATSHGPDDEYILRWSIDDPDAVAAELVERAQDLDGIEARDRAEDAERERYARSIFGRAASAYRFVDRMLLAKLRR